ncbi:uncharacterized protein LOC107482567 [Arachis duranensis]|uniref:Uncharacterized protein LOC107482567 n=1 Tax=Arachis duranensis TaxID=130453 RepID=A0A6P4CYL0_ARADU|nr:uncharacterized protein LOC107482567 [Arachis duranensis]
MRGGYVRGGASRAHDPRTKMREEGELIHRSMKKVKKAGGGEFTGDTGLTPRLEDWMVEEEVEGGDCRTEPEPEKKTQMDEDRGETRSPPSFADKVRNGKSKEEGRKEDIQANREVVSSEDEDEEYLEITVKKLPSGIYNIVIGEGVKRELRKNWWETLIVKLLGRKISLVALKRRLEVMWGKNGSIDVIDLGNEFFLVKFYNSEDLDFALMEGPWKILDHYLTIRLWKPDFNPTETIIDSTAAWIRLPGLAIEYYNKAVLEKIGNIVGRTLKVDTNTADVARGKFARVCVEVDLTKPLVSQFQINGKNHLVEYEGLHQVCFLCGRFGHDKSSCTEKQRMNNATQKNQEEAQQANSDVEGKGRIENNTENRGKKVMEGPVETYGPWILVQRNTRGRKSTEGGEGSSSGGNVKEKENKNTVSENKSRFAVLENEVSENVEAEEVGEDNAGRLMNEREISQERHKEGPEPTDRTNQKTNGHNSKK